MEKKSKFKRWSNGIRGESQTMTHTHVTAPTQFVEANGIRKNGLGFPRTRGEVAAQEQLRAFGQATATSKGEPQVPRTRGEVAAKEQIRAFGQVFATKGELRAPTTRGEVAAQEQMRIISQATGNFVQNRKPVEAKGINYVG